jgi:tetratricopeptide (TPR) repeat protein
MSRACEQLVARAQRSRRHAALVLAVACALAAQGCCKKPDKNGAAAEGRSWGGEVVDETDGIAKPATTGSTPQAQKPGEEPRSQEDFRPVVPDAPPVDNETKEIEAPKGPSPWGATDAESGKPLPARVKPNKEAAKLIEAGNKQSVAGKDVDARKSFEKALVADPRAVAAAFNLGVLADRAGQTNVALQYYAKALAIQPDYERAAEGTARIYLRQGQAAQAVAFLAPIATQWERNLHIQAIYATALIEANRLDEAEQVARKALRRDERFEPAIVALAKASMKRGRLELADAILEQAHAVNPNYYEVHILQARRHVQEGRTAQALASYRRAVERRPDNAESRTELGLLYLAAGNYTEAVQQLEAVVKLVPTLVAPHLNLGDAYRASKRWQEAKKELDTALRLQSTLPEAHFDLGLLYYEAGEGFPGLTKIESLKRAQLELNTYRDQSGPRLAKDDPSVGYLADIARQMEREQRRIEREAAQKKRATERGPSEGQ